MAAYASDPLFLQEIGFQQKDNLGNQLVVNIRKELCGAFVNTINFTLVNYTANKLEQQQEDRKRLTKL